MLRTIVIGLAILFLATGADTRALGETAEENYRLYCVQCHGTLGNGEGINQTSGGLTVSPIDHSYAQEMAKRTDAELRLAIAGGGDAVQKSELMPPWDKTLSGEEIDDLVGHLRELCRCRGPE